MRQYIGAPMPRAISIGGPMVSLAYRTEEVKKRGGPNSSVRLAYYQANRLSFTNRKPKYVEEKRTDTLKIRQTSIATV